MTFPPLYLVTGWQIASSGDLVWENVDSLVALSPDQVVLSGRVRLRCVFDLEPIGDICVRYWLHVASTPINIEVLVNGYPVTLALHEGGQSYSADITDCVTLDDNELVLTFSSAGDLGSVTIQPVPCPISG
jgi:hypothetical protein